MEMKSREDLDAVSLLVMFKASLSDLEVPKWKRARLLVAPFPDDRIILRNGHRDINYRMTMTQSLEVYVKVPCVQ